MSQPYFIENPVSRTLLIPLIIRAQESYSSKGLFRDPAAEEAVARLPREVFDFSMHPFMRIGTAVRVRYFDDLIAAALAASDHPVIVQLGCGLDTSFSRNDKGRGLHINIDLPEVIELREKLIPEANERCLNMATSILETAWMDELKNRYPDARFTFISQGVLMYFQEDEVRGFIRNLAARFPGSELAFDTAGRKIAAMINKKSAVSQLKASLTWAYDDDGSLDAWHPRLRRLGRTYYFNQFRSRWGIFCLMHFVPGLGKGSAMFHYAIDQELNNSEAPEA